MLSTQAWLLLAASVAVGVLHTMVPDHWVPIALLARRRGFNTAQVAKTAAIAGLGHTVSTLIIAAIVWIAGVALAARFGALVNAASSAALIAFGLWIAVGSLRELRKESADSGFASLQARTALLLILGSSPAIEVIPAFFAASRYGAGLLAGMAILFAVSTIGTYVALSVTSARGIQRLNFGHFERYGEVFSGAFIAVLGIVFLLY